MRFAVAALLGLEPVGGSPVVFAKRMHDESVVWLRIAKVVGLRKD